MSVVFSMSVKVLQHYIREWTITEKENHDVKSLLNFIKTSAKVDFQFKLLRSCQEMENQYIGGKCQKRGLGQFAGLRGWMAKKMGVVLLRGVGTPMHTMITQCSCKSSDQKLLL